MYSEYWSSPKSALLVPDNIIKLLFIAWNRQRLKRLHLQRRSNGKSKIDNSFEGRIKAYHILPEVHLFVSFILKLSFF